jgi:hypothetical protein
MKNVSSSDSGIAWNRASSEDNPSYSTPGGAPTGAPPIRASARAQPLGECQQVRAPFRRPVFELRDQLRRDRARARERAHQRAGHRAQRVGVVAEAERPRTRSFEIGR